MRYVGVLKTLSLMKRIASAWRAFEQRDVHRARLAARLVLHRAAADHRRDVAGFGRPLADRAVVELPEQSALSSPLRTRARRTT